MLIQDLETGDAYKRELDTLVGLYAMQYKRMEVQDSIVSTLKASLKLAQEGWATAEDIINIKDAEMRDMKLKHKRKLNLYKGIITGLSVALILL